MSLAASNAQELYLSGQISEEDLIHSYLEATGGRKKASGTFYTPEWIVRAMISRIGLSSPSQSIVEPSCGRGAFILPLLSHAQTVFQMTWPETLEWFKKRVTCIDIDPRAIADLKEILYLFFQRKGLSDIGPGALDNIVCADGLTIAPRSYDIALGNPPYIRTRLLDRDYLGKLRGSYQSMRKGNVDIYYAFLERYAELAQRTVFIVPNGCLKATSAQTLREKTFPKLEQVIDFEHRRVFPGAHTYTAILVFDRSHVGPMLHSNHTDAPANTIDWKSICAQPAGKASKNTIRSGVATLADTVFVLSKDLETGVVEGICDGRRYPIEPGILRPFYKVTKITSQGDFDRPTRFILFPYDHPSGAGVMNEEKLAREFPVAHSYLTACRPRLEARDRGKTDRYPAWYAFGRSQGLFDFSSQSLILVPRMVGGLSKPTLIDTSYVTGRFGPPLLVSGFAIKATERNKRLLLSQDFIRFLSTRGAPRSGAGEPYYEIRSRDIRDYLSEE